MIHFYHAPLRFVCAALTLMLSACQPASVLNTVTPSGSYQLTTDVKYGEHPRQRMDIYLPRDQPYQQQVVVFVYGGSWESGDKSDFPFIAQAFTRLGYITVLPNYRLYPEVEFPEFIHDVAAAIGALPDKLPAQCPSADKLILAGHSAGAHTAALLATDARYLEQAGASLEQISAFIGLAGPYDLPLDHEQVRDKFTQVEGNEANPVALATAQTPPTLLIHGLSDNIALPDHAERFKARLETLGIPVTLHLYPRRRHIDLVASLASPLRFWTPAYQDIQQYLQDQGLDKRCAP